jgi:6-phosphogluconolactonase
LSGGSTPKPAYELLAGELYRYSIDWSCVHVFWGDERCVRPDDVRSNYGMSRAALLDHVPIPAGNVHRIRGELPPADAARGYERSLVEFFGSSPARFDLVFLGLGTNGHTAALFPATAVLHEPVRRAAEVYVAEQDIWRVTLTTSVLNAAAVVAFLVSGSDKSDVLRDVIFGPREPYRLPAQLVQPTAGETRWLVDRASGPDL